jgi:hypothetical protein
MAEIWAAVCQISHWYNIIMWNVAIWNEIQIISEYNKSKSYVIRELWPVLPLW